MLTGSIPSLVLEPPASPNEGCTFFPNPFNRIFKMIDFTKFTKAAADEIEGLVQLETLNLGKSIISIIVNVLNGYYSNKSNSYFAPIFSQ